MAFILTLTNDQPFDIGQAENNWVAIATVGYDDETSATYSIFISLGPSAGDPPGTCHLYFALVEHDGETGHEHDFLDGLDTLPKIPDRAHRREILDAVCAGVYALAQQAEPDIVHFASVRDKLPPKALSKYWSIADVLRRCGMTCRKADEWHGRHAWIAKRGT